MALLRNSLLTSSLAVAILCAAPAAAQRSAAEYDVKAAFLFNFVRFSEWPEAQLDGREAFSVGILGDDPFGSSIAEAMGGKTLKGLPVRIVRGNRPSDLRDCQVVFVSTSERERLEEHLTALAGLAVLTVSDAGRFPEMGGIVGLFVDGSRVRFRINRDALDRSGLRMSSRLLALAERAGIHVPAAYNPTSGR